MAVVRPACARHLSARRAGGHQYVPPVGRDVPARIVGTERSLPAEGTYRLRGCSQCRRGVTLVELLLALAILVAMAALAAPSVHRAWERYRVKLAGDQVRAALTHAHVEAMRTGQIQVMRFEIGGDRYATQPWMAGDEMINASAKEAFEQMQPQYQLELVKPETLPEDVTFAQAQATFDTRAVEIETEAAQQQTGIAASTQWSQPLLFYPDGTSSQAKITMANKRGQAVQVTLRKLTGLTTVSDVTTLETLQSQEVLGREELP